MRSRVAARPKFSSSATATKYRRCRSSMLSAAPLHVSCARTRRRRRRFGWGDRGALIGGQRAELRDDVRAHKVGVLEQLGVRRAGEQAGRAARRGRRRPRRRCRAPRPGTPDARRARRRAAAWRPGCRASRTPRRIRTRGRARASSRAVPRRPSRTTRSAAPARLRTASRRPRVASDARTVSTSS